MQDSIKVLWIFKDAWYFSTIYFMRLRHEFKLYLYTVDIAHFHDRDFMHVIFNLANDTLFE